MSSTSSLDGSGNEEMAGEEGLDPLIDEGRGVVWEGSGREEERVAGEGRGSGMGGGVVWEGEWHGRGSGMGGGVAWEGEWHGRGSGMGGEWHGRGEWTLRRVR